MTSREEFLQLLNQTPTPLAAAALLAVQILKQDTGPARQSTQEALQVLTELRLLARRNGAGENAESLTRFIGDELGFVGNSLDYYSADNSDLGHVLSAKVGIPITLALLYIDFGCEAGLDIRGIGFPGHFLVGHYAPSSNPDELREVDLIDPFTHELVDRSSCIERVLAQLPSGSQRPTAEQAAAWFQPVPAATLLLRVLENLKQIHLRNKSPHAGLAALELQLLIAPEQAELRAQHAQLERATFGGGTTTTLH